MTSISLRKSLRSVPSAAPVEQGRSDTCTSVIVWQKFLFRFYDPNSLLLEFCGAVFNEEVVQRYVKYFGAPVLTF